LSTLLNTTFWVRSYGGLLTASNNGRMTLTFCFA